jgi:PKD repeat protein
MMSHRDQIKCFCALVLGLACCLSLNAQGATLTWNGAGNDGAISDYANWTPGQAPVAADDLIINSNTGAPITWDINATATVNSLTVNSAFTSTITLAKSITTTGNLTLNGGAGFQLLTANTSATTIAVGGNLTVGANSTVVARHSSLAGNGTGQTITVTGNATVLGQISADEQGFDGVTSPGYQTGPSRGGEGPGTDGGGGHGGTGGMGNVITGSQVDSEPVIETANLGGNCYGSIVQPTSLGSMGGGEAESIGGGAIQLTVLQTLTLTGSITANGGSVNGSSGSHGGAAGGSVYLTAGALTGTGTIAANGGNATATYTGGAGGGGRVAIIATTSTFTGAVSAYGGYSNSNFGATNGSNGTVYEKIGTAVNGNLIIDNNNNSNISDDNITTNPSQGYADLPTDQPSYTFDSVILRNQGRLRVNTGAQLNNIDTTVSGDGTGVLIHDGGTLTTTSTAMTISNWILEENTGTISTTGEISPTLTDLTIGAGGVLSHTANGNPAIPADNDVLNLSLNSLTVAAGGKIDVSGKGYAPGYGPGVGQDNNGQHEGLGSGGGYGGQGGDVPANGGVALSTGGPCYGSITAPTDLGSGGIMLGAYNAALPIEFPWVNGGGAAQLTVLNALTVNGSILANGQDTNAGEQWATGSGGSLYITAGALAGTGTISANGGNVLQGYTGGSGGGGRIAIYAPKNTFVGPISAYGGSSESTLGKPGAAGSVLVNGALIIDNNNLVTTDISDYNANVTAVSPAGQNGISTFTLQNGASVVIESGKFAEFSGNLTIGAGTTLQNIGTLIVAGNWSNNGTYIDTLGTVNFTGTGTQVIKGSSTFNNLTDTVPGATLAFAKGSTQTVTGNLNLQGNSTKLLNLVSTAPRQTWSITPNMSQITASYLSVTDSINTNATAINPQSSYNGGDTTEWFTPGTFNQYKFSVQPGGAVAGLPFTQQPVVEVVDAFGTLVNDNQSITLSIWTGNGTLAGYTSIESTGGSATFTNLEIDQAGTYTLTATGNPFPVHGVVNSVSFTVSPGPAAVLAFITQPSNSTGGIPFLTQPVVALEDAFNNVVTGPTDTITLQIDEGDPNTTGSGSLMGTSSLALTGSTGMASFTNLALSLTGTYVLKASDSTNNAITSVDSAPIFIGVGPATQIVLVTPPSDSTGGVIFATQPVVAIEDAGGDIVTGYADTVSVTVYEPTTTDIGGVLIANADVDITTGLAKFSGLYIDPVNVYQLSFADDTLEPNFGTVYYSPLNITVGPPSQIAFTTEPGNGTAGSAFVQPVVTLEDAGGNTVTTNNTQEITITINSGPNGSTLQGTNQLTVTDGVATFTNLQINKAGTNYSLTATPTGSALAAVNSTPNFTIAPGAAVLLTVSGFPSPDIAGAAHSVTVTAMDGFGNVATGYTGTVAITSGDPDFVPPANHTFIPTDAGTFNFLNVTLNTAGIQYITATDTVSSSITGQQTGINVVPPIVFASAPTATPDATDVGMLVAFATSASGGPGTLTYAWNFGDSIGTATGATPTYSYTAPGTYTATVTATDSLGDAKNDSVQVVVNADLTVNTTTATPNPAGVGQTVSFAATVSGGTGTLTYAWNFGDSLGTTSTAATPTFAYTAAGTYTARVTVMDAVGGQATNSVQVTISAISIASTTATPSTIDAGQTVSFSTSATGGTGTLTYSWNFGDGTAAGSGANPTHAYSTSGPYTATVTVTDGIGNQQLGTVAVTVNPVISITTTTATPSTVDVGQTVSFSASATGGTIPLTYDWTFGDAVGTATDTATPTYVYTATGTYTATVTVTDAVGGTKNATVQVIVNADVTVNTPTATPNPAGVGQTVSFSVTASGGTIPLTYAWTFGDAVGTATGATPTYIYTAPGTYTATVTVTDSVGNQQIGTVKVTVSQISITTPTATPSTADVGQPVSFSTSATGGTGTLTYAWTFGDGVGTATGATPTYAYTTAGTYTAKVTVTDSVGVSNSATVSVTVNSVISFSTPPSAAANPAGLPTYGVGQTITFSGTATGGSGTITYSWNFGDGSPAGSGANPTHSYATAGTYTVTVTATDSQGNSTKSTITITVAAPVVGTGTDVTGDGYSDAFLAATGYVPTGPATAATVQPLTITKKSVKLNFTQTGKDSISISGSLAIPSGFSATNQKVDYAIGGIMGFFTLGAKGVSTPKGNDTFTLKFKSTKGVVQAQTGTFTMAFKNGSFAATLAANGFVKGTSTKSTTSTVTMPVTLIFNGAILQDANLSFAYKASSKSGSAK